MSERGLLRFNVILSELSVIVYKTTDFRTYKDWVMYFNKMLKSGAHYSQTLIRAWVNDIVNRLHSIYGINHKEIINMILDYLDGDKVLEYYEFTQHTYTSFIYKD